ncbi:MAG: hypothetical protein KTR26_04680 [Flammeovirgaceae bacterium]|nr:hypothetical protein [Flammeovirgaceae bacterium]
MGNLTSENIEYLNQHLVKKEVKYDPLKGEMLDHICCELEELMEEGMSFPEAYMEFSKTVSSNNIKAVENETIHLVNHKLFIMRKVIYILGALTASIFAFCVLFKLMHWPGALELFFIFWTLCPILIITAAVYYYQMSELNGKNKFAFFLAVVCSLSLIVGGFFKILHLPFGGILLMIGFVGGAIFTIPYFFYSLYQKGISGNS